MKKNLACLSVLTCSLIYAPLHASHLKAMEISYRRIGCSLEYEITITAYVNTNSTVSFGGGSFLSFGDGNLLEVPDTQSQLIDVVRHIGKVTFKTTHTYPGVGDYLISYSENNRNEGVINFSNSVQTPLEISADIQADLICNSSPVLTIPPVDFACKGLIFYHNPGAVDAEGDSLSYELVVPNDGSVASGYRFPNDAQFYTNYNQGNEAKDGPPAIKIDPMTGTLTWDAPDMIGEYTVDIKIIEWRFDSVTKTWNRIGYVIRDMAIIVEDCRNQRPTLIASDYCVEAGNTVDLLVTGADPDNDDVVIEAFGEIFSLADNPAPHPSSDGVIQTTSAPNGPAALHLIWNTSCANVRSKPYTLVLKITDKPTEGTSLVFYKTVNITVVGPAPQYGPITVNPVKGTVELQWRDDLCENVKTFRVWRRISRYVYTQPECETGMPTSLRYQLLAEVPSTKFSYIDNDLSIGAQYCYRITALIGDKAIESRISVDTCIIPQPARAPVITTVSVSRTDDQQGEVLLKWTTPFEIDQIQYPPPYQYKVYRSQGMSNDEGFSLITQEPIGDTVFVDRSANTLEYPYKYNIALFVPAISADPVDTSSTASTVRLNTMPLPAAISLEWDARTPWYNYSQNYPYHLILRSENPAAGFEVIDSVNVNEEGFRFTDNGTFGNTPLRPDVSYYYKVLTRGTYGNPKIMEPLQNFSQTNGGMLLDIVPPGAPVVMLADFDCRTVACSGGKYFNRMTIQSPANEPDVSSFNVYAKNDNGALQLLGNVSDPTFVDNNLPARAKCYVVTSLDKTGNESAPSEIVCADNCPYFELPNVFTPLAQDELNDYFEPFTSHSSDSSKCARFVIQIDVSIYDRWGQKIHSAKATSEADYHLWDGTTAGTAVSPGVYYYNAEVQFDVREASQKLKQYHGWVRVAE